MLYFTSEPNPTTDIWALPMRGDAKPFPVVETSFNERDGQFSPDGRWIAYQSNESGRFEIYAQSFPGTNGKVQVSSNGGAMARWRDDGRELFYVGSTTSSWRFRFSSDHTHLTPGHQYRCFGRASAVPSRETLWLSTCPLPTDSGSS